MREKYNFNISLSVLNHLGRNLYRNIITVLGEAISNSWDADANNVWITINREQNSMYIVDDGNGMTDEDFQEKFLKIGYSKRKEGCYKSSLGRPYIGRKGIGKLALLSCAQRVHILSRTDGGDFVGGIIDNSALDQAITDDLNSQDYVLEPLNAVLADYMDSFSHGTVLYFETISTGIVNTVEYIKKAIALYFRFSLIDPDFNIYVNDDLINENYLKDFAENTQFLWRINDFSDPMFQLMKNLQGDIRLSSGMNISGYIASVTKPSYIKIRGTQERATIDLFVNGRLREKDILRHIPTARIVENYVYGQIHYNDLDTGDSKDIFTSSREGIISNEPVYSLFLKELDRIFKKILDEWDTLRRKHGDDGDPDNTQITPKARKAQELFNTTIKDLQSETPFIKKGSVVDGWVQKLSEEAQFNVPSYTECFISENLLRCYVNYTNMPISQEAKTEADRWRQREAASKGAANISYDVRTSSNDLYYLDMDHLANLVDKAPDKLKDAGISRSAVIYKPIRDAVGHTSLITPTAKSQLSLEYENIKARLINLLKQMQS